MSSILDVPGIQAGHAQRTGDGWLTGVSVVLPAPGTVGGVDVRGGGPGTHETDALGPTTLVPTVDAVVLTGGSAFGLVSASGVQRWCYEQGRGFAVGDDPAQVVPIVPAAALFDLGRGGRFDAWPDADLGYAAAKAASRSSAASPLPVGNVGAGTGALVAGGRFKGGLGSACISLDGGLSDVRVGALVAVNAAGAPVGCAGAPVGGAAPTVGDAFATTIAVVATNVDLDPAETSRTATAAHDGMARALDPVHTLADGDTVFALATGLRALPGNRRHRVEALIAVQAAAAHALTAAIYDAIRSATPVTTPAGTWPAWPRGGDSA
ncbi:MAG: P1 family peptidase [Cellulomonas sp.]|jgi:L-aminopeptidase/D-esterase-like protein|nr:P1 family peptidase [Cellulomonas sp.]